jgi:tetratricopeptide (TPR) repeat protein
MADLTSAIELNPDLLDGYFNRGQLYKELGQPKKARVDFQRAVTMSALTPDALTSRGMAFLNLQRHLDAVRDFTAAIDLNPNFVAAYRGRSLDYMQMGDLPAAQKDVFRAAELREAIKQGALPPP